jgi:hypothetical protein
VGWGRYGSPYIQSRVLKIYIPKIAALIVRLGWQRLYCLDSVGTVYPLLTRLVTADTADIIDTVDIVLYGPYRLIQPYTAFSTIFNTYIAFIDKTLLERLLEALYVNLILYNR